MCCVPLQLARAQVMSSERTRTRQRYFVYFYFSQKVFQLELSNTK